MSVADRGKSITDKDPKDDKEGTEHLTKITRLKAEKQQAQLKEMKDMKKQLKNSVPKQEFEIVRNECDQLKLDLLDASSQIQTLTHELAKAKKESKEKGDKLLKIEGEMSTIRDTYTNQIMDIQKDLVTAQTKLAAQQLEMEEVNKEKIKNESKMKEYNQEIEELQRRLNESMKSFHNFSTLVSHDHSNGDNSHINAASDWDWQRRVDEIRAQHHVEIQRMKKGYELEIAGLKTEIQHLKIHTETHQFQKLLQNQFDETINKSDKISSGNSEQIEKKLNHVKEMAAQRENVSKIVQEINEQWINYKSMAEGELNMLKQRLAEFENGNVEVVLRIDLEDTVKNRVGAPKRPAPTRPEDNSPEHSRQSSHDGSVIAYENENTGVSQHLTSEALARHAQMTNEEQEHTHGDDDEMHYARINGILSGKSVVKDNSPTPVYEELSDAAKEALTRKLQMRHIKSASTASGQRAQGEIERQTTENDEEEVMSDKEAYQRYTQQSPHKLSANLNDTPANRFHRPVASANNILHLSNGKSESQVYHMTTGDRKKNSLANINRGSQTPTQLRASASGGGNTSQEWMTTLRRKVIENFSSGINIPRTANEHILAQNENRVLSPSSPPPPRKMSSSMSHRSHASSREGSLMSISEIDKYLGLDDNGNSKVPDELKISQEQLKNLQHSEQNKNKQLQIQYAMEKKTWTEKVKELQDKIVQMEQTLKNTQRKLREKVEQNTLLRDQFQMLQQQFSELPAQTQAEAQERIKFKQHEQIKVQQSQQALYNQIDVQRQQMAQMQGTIEQLRFTIETLQKGLAESKEKIKSLETKLEDAQSDLAKQLPTSNKDLLQQQIRVLKTQRKVLVKEIKDLRGQNDMLKNMIVTGGKNPS